jgi:hypothetical protein
MNIGLARKGEEGTGVWKNLHNEKCWSCYPLPDFRVKKERRMRGGAACIGCMYIRSLVGESKEERAFRTLGIPIGGNTILK